MKSVTCLKTEIEIGGNRYVCYSTLNPHHPDIGEWGIVFTDEDSVVFRLEDEPTEVSAMIGTDSLLKQTKPQNKHRRYFRRKSKYLLFLRRLLFLDRSRQGTGAQNPDHA